MNTGQQSFNNLLVILAKAIILVIIVICIFFIVYPQACHNIMVGNIIEDGREPQQKPEVKVVNSDNPQGVKANGQNDTQDTDTDEDADTDETDPEYGQIIIDANAPKEEPQKENPAPAEEKKMTLEELAKAQDEFDYKVIQAYVKAEKEYTKANPNDRQAAQAVTAQVMKDMKLNEDDWQEILLKADEKDWFTKAREEEGIK